MDHGTAAGQIWVPGWQPTAGPLVTYSKPRPLHGPLPTPSLLPVCPSPPLPDALLRPAALACAPARGARRRAPAAGSPGGSGRAHSAQGAHPAAPPRCSRWCSRQAAGSARPGSGSGLRCGREGPRAAVSRAGSVPLGRLGSGRRWMRQWVSLMGLPCGRLPASLSPRTAPSSVQA